MVTLYRAHAFTKNLGFLTCQLLSFESGRKKHEYNTREMHVGKKKERENNNSFSQQFKVSTVKICNNIEYLIGPNFIG